MIDYPGGARTHTSSNGCEKFLICYSKWLCLNCFSACQMAYISISMNKCVCLSDAVEFILWELQEVNCDGLAFLICYCEYTHKHADNFVFFLLLQSQFYWAKWLKTRQIFDWTAYLRMLIFRLANFMTWLDILVVFLLVPRVFFSLFILHWLLIALFTIDLFEYSQHTTTHTAQRLRTFGISFSSSIEVISSQFYFALHNFLSLEWIWKTSYGNYRIDWNEEENSCKVRETMWRKRK